MSVAAEHVVSAPFSFLRTRFTLVLSSLTLALALHWPAALRLHQLWTDADNSIYTHGYLVAATAAWLIWRRREYINGAPAAPVFGALVPLIVAELLWLLAFQSGIGLGYLILLPVLLWLVVLIGFGLGVARVLLLPLAYPYFAMPIWGVLNPIAQWGTVFAVRPLLYMSGVNAYFTGNLVHLSSATIEIAGGCSGLRYIMVALAIATLLGELRNDGPRMRVQLLALAAALAVIGNWIRVFIVILAGDLTHMQHYLVKRSHVGFGWCVFAMAMLMFFLIERRWPITPPPNSHDPGSVGGSIGTHSVSGSRGLTLGLMALTLAMPLAIGALISRNATVISSALPTLQDQWEGPRPLKSDWHPVFVGADSESHGAYYLGDVGVEVYTAWFATQQQGKNLNGYWNSVVGSFYTSAAPTATEVRGKLFFQALMRSPNGQTWTVLYGYAADGHWFTSPLRAQLWCGLKAVVTMRAPASHVLAARARCTADCTNAIGAVRALLERADFVP